MTEDRLVQRLTAAVLNMDGVRLVDRDYDPRRGDCEQLRAVAHDGEQFIITIRKVARPKSRTERFREGPPW